MILTVCNVSRFYNCRMYPELPPVPGSGDGDSLTGRRRRITKTIVAARDEKAPLNLVTLENGSEPEVAHPMLQRRRRQQQNLLVDQERHLPVADDNGRKSRSRGSIG